MTTRVALVTGAAQGIGQAIALRLAKDGLDVAVDDIASKATELDLLVKQIQGLGRRAIALTEDVTQEHGVKRMVEETVTALGSLDVMVANAGVAPKKVVTIAEADLSDWDALLAVNLRGVVMCYKYAAKQMIKQGTGGRIIGASSICGLKGYAGLGDYCMSKAAVRSLTQSSALELKEHNIQVNAYAPGVINTAMARNDVHDKELGGPTSTTKQILRIPDAKTGDVNDVASLVSYLASPEAHFITGQTMAVDGAQSL
ncbi:NAD(P)-binding protein [Macrolepiota fuliginosa MF-IS2]|uniref:NAD(P)-binding protein n=1 Tax=Macrolepiota fuliginosa MF-IS2 TaxID=1400762 RepID=A0A9P5XCQ7_9AGAR|nr:NAD(P)-binding protein [Macrolepiota fuliginosa MF-IS2]